MDTHFLNVQYDDKDTVRARFDIRWDKACRRWYAGDEITAQEAQACANELVENRHQLERQIVALEEAARQKKLAALVAAASKVTLPDISELDEMSAILRRSRGFAMAEDVHRYRALHGHAEDFFNLFGCSDCVRNANARMKMGATLDAMKNMREVLATVHLNGHCK